MTFQPINVGSLSLDQTYAPLVNLSFEYFTTQGGEIIGGLQKYTISGVVSVSDTTNPGSLTGSTVMSKLKNIRNLGKQPQCLDVTIPGFYTGKAKITNVSIEQGNDPSWVNQGAFSIELNAPLSSIPENSFGFTVNDFVKDVSRSEKVEIGEDSHGYVYTLSGGSVKLSKAYVKFTNEIQLTCQPLCSDQAIPNTIAILKRIVATGPTHLAFSKYQSWRPFLQSRSLEIQTSGSVTFRCDMILVPPTVTANAFVDVSFEHSRNYDPQQQQMSKKSTGTVTGLVSVGWSDLVTLSDTCSVSKLTNAESAFSSIKNTLSSLNNWDGITLELNLLPNCPTNLNSDCTSGFTSTSDCYKPTNSTITKSRTEGSITFDFEWNNTSCTSFNGQTVVEVDITEPQPNLAEFIIPDYGTLIQNLNCDTAKIISFTGSTTYPGANGCVSNIVCSANNAINAAILEYIPENDPNWLLIQNSKTSTMTSVSITKKYIRKCLT